MTSLQDTICMKRWQVYLMLAMSGFAVGSILAKTVVGLGV